MMIAVIRFPGSNCDLDAVHALGEVIGIPVELVWHEQFDNSKYSGVILPGGFSYGDHLRGGIIAAFSPAVDGVRRMADEGKPVLGICNGFQVLIEAGLLPGALLRNEGLAFVCKWVTIRVQSNKSVFSKSIPKGSVLRIPIAHNEGRYFISEKEYSKLEENDQIVFKYVDYGGVETEESNPNGSLYSIAGLCNEKGNVLGMMPHPERASEAILGGESGKQILEAFKV
ncbi:MAG: phosphoribosylformylglycinamidine synthase I [Candidatus Micrarchaeota archaeon]